MRNIGSFDGMRTTYEVLYIEIKLGRTLHALLYSTGLKLSFTLPQKLVKFLAICEQTKYFHSDKSIFSIIFTVHLQYMFSNT